MAARRAESLEAAIGAALDAWGHEQEALWAQAELGAVMVLRRGLSQSAWASEVGCTAARLRKRVAAVRAFPREVNGFALMPFEAHVARAGTDDRRGWMERAEAGGWSVSKLRAQVRAADARVEDGGLAAGEALVQRLRK
jgi:hypothetical protein